MSTINKVGGPNIAAPAVAKEPKAGSTTDFAKVLGEAVDTVSGAMAGADKTAAAALVGDAEPHQAMIAMTKADLAFRFMTQARNKAISAYREVMNMQM